MTFARNIEVIPLGDPPPDAALLAWLARGIEHTLRIRTRVGSPLGSSAEWCCAPERYSSNAVVETLIARGNRSAIAAERWILGVTTRDLAAPQRDFVFGEATFGGAWAVVSTARLMKAAGGAAAAGRDALLKESLHELGHLAGLVHCTRATCLMAHAGHSADVERKDTGFCASCAVSFRQKVGLDPANFRH